MFKLIIAKCPPGRHMPVPGWKVIWVMGLRPYDLSKIHQHACSFLN